MDVPLFKEIGKQVKDLFEKNFYFDCLKLQMKNSFDVTLSQLAYDENQGYSIKDGKLVGNLKHKYKFEGITFTPKISTELSAISGELHIRRHEFHGINWNITGNYNLQNGSKQYEIGWHYKTPDFNIEVATMQNDPKVKVDGSLLRTAGVINLSGVLIGASLIVEPQEPKIVQSKLISAYEYDGYTFIMNGELQKKQATCSFYKQFPEMNLQTGLSASAKIHSDATKIDVKQVQGNAAICVEFKPNNEVTLKSRFNSDCLFGLAYILNIREGINLTVSTEIDLPKLQHGHHKVGFGIEFL